MKIFLDLLKVCIIFLGCLGILIVLMVKLLEYKAKKMKNYDDEILLDNEFVSLSVSQLREREKKVIKKITGYSFVEFICVFFLIVTFFYFGIIVQNDDNNTLIIILFMIEVISLIAIWIRKRVLKQERYKCLTFIDKKNDDNHKGKK